MKWFDRDEIINALDGAIREYYKNICMHEETYRGGFIWTICNDCGMKWADDRGGFKPYEVPERIEKAEELLIKLNKR